MNPQRRLTGLCARRLFAAGLFVLAAAGPAAAEVPYTATLTVAAGEDGVEKRIRDIAQTLLRQKDPPESRAALARRVADDRRGITDTLRALGYFDSRVESGIDRNASPTAVSITVDPGPLYLVRDVAVAVPTGAPPLPADFPAIETFGVALGDPVRSADILAAEGHVLARLREAGRPLARRVDRRIVVDHALRAATVTWIVDPGPAARFGETRIEGLVDAREPMVRRRLRWQAGEAYDSRKVDATRKALAGSGLFSSVRIAAADRVDPDGTVPMTVTLVEGERRSVGGGLRYSTSTGFGTELFWEHRDLFGNGDRVRLSGTFAEQELGATATYRRPYFLADEQDLVASLTLADEKPPAYDNRFLRIHGGIERRFPPHWTAGAGLQYERMEVTAQRRTNRYHLVGAPVFLRRDTSDDLLNPTSGYRTTLSATPYFGVEDGALGVLKLRIDQTAYWRLDEEGSWVLAAGASLGSLLGAGRGEVPAPQRFYAGGGGSVRGFGFQMAGPVDAAGDPLGGKSLLTGGAELRIKVTETIGVVPFLEAGTVTDSTLPGFGDRLFVGAGIGLRYYTSFGPVRLDLATPLNRRDGVDDLVQVYISLGQAF
ncbi:autotransporter assembly complex family protein [Stella sp.]|uniref:autotransporter assembly complex protein TamA n=1 Tax=Stella sp. TaxID=2912054 RepID=UPI0035AE841B